MIIEMDTYYLIRKHFNAGRSIRWIAKTYHLSRQTVRKYCYGDTHPEIRKDYHRDASVVTQDVQTFILECFKEDAIEGLPKQKHTAKRIYDRLVEEKGFTGAESTIRKAVNDLRKEHTVPPQADVPLAYDAGDAIQIDWGECTVYLNNVKKKLYMFCSRLCYSCAIYTQCFFSQNQESFLEALQRTFDYFGGVPRRVIFDNAKVAVKEGFGLHAKATDGYAAFSAHYAFAPEFCNIASGNEKGLVENLVGFARRNFVVPVLRKDTIYDINQLLTQRCDSYNKTHVVKSRHYSVFEAYADDRAELQPIPSYRFDTCRKSIAKVNDYSLVRFDRNNYSVPTRYIRKDVTVKGYANTVQILHDCEIIAEFDRNYGTKNTAYKLEHYIDLIERKPRSVFQAKPVRETVTQELILTGKRLPHGNADMVKLLRLCTEHGEEKILKICRAVPIDRTLTIELIRSELCEQKSVNIIHFNRDVDVHTPDLHRYDEKCGVM